MGLVASRLTETFYRPSLVMRGGDGEASGVAGLTRGSARSIEGFHVTKALEACDDFCPLWRHARAAGFTLANDNLPAFYERCAPTPKITSMNHLAPQVHVTPSSR